jgi:hypothetical protein
VRLRLLGGGINGSAGGLLPLGAGCAEAAPPVEGRGGRAASGIQVASRVSAATISIVSAIPGTGAGMGATAGAVVMPAGRAGTGARVGAVAVLRGVRRVGVDGER